MPQLHESLLGHKLAVFYCPVLLQTLPMRETSQIYLYTSWGAALKARLSSAESSLKARKFSKGRLAVNVHMHLKLVACCRHAPPITG